MLEAVLSDWRFDRAALGDAEFTCLGQEGKKSARDSVVLCRVDDRYTTGRGVELLISCLPGTGGETKRRGKHSSSAVVCASCTNC